MLESGGRRGRLHGEVRESLSEVAFELKAETGEEGNLVKTRGSRKASAETQKQEQTAQGFSRATAGELEGGGREMGPKANNIRCGGTGHDKEFGLVLAAAGKLMEDFKLGKAPDLACALIDWMKNGQEIGKSGGRERNQVAFAVIQARDGGGLN